MRGDAGSVRRVQRGCVLLRTNEDFSFDDSELESKLVWIWGSPRTGSTWLLEMLCHPLKVDPNSDLGFRWREEWNGAAAALPVNEFLISAHIAPGNGATRMENGMVLPMTLNRYSEGFSSYAFSIAYEDVWRPEVRRLTLIRLYAVIKRAREAGLQLAADPPLMVIKEVNGSHGADLVMSLFPRSKMIFLARDGRDVLDSLLDANTEGGWMTQGNGPARCLTRTRTSAVSSYARAPSAGPHAPHVCNVAYERHDPELRRKIRYEDLLADTEANFTDLASWLELPGGPKRIENIVKAHSFTVPRTAGAREDPPDGTPGAWREA